MKYRLKILAYFTSLFLPYVFRCGSLPSQLTVAIMYSKFGCLDIENQNRLLINSDNVTLNAQYYGAKCIRNIA